MTRAPLRCRLSNPLLLAQTSAQSLRERQKTDSGLWVDSQLQRIKRECIGMLTLARTTAVVVNQALCSCADINDSSSTMNGPIF
ncbi:hypothetical protein DFH08DRAFT_1077814, partial [Mycena albidolilacea]